MEEELKSLVNKQFLQIKAMQRRMEAVEKMCEAIAERIGLASGDTPLPLESADVPEPPAISTRLQTPSNSGETADLMDDGSRNTDGSGAHDLKNTIIAIVTNSERPLSFEDIYARLKQETPAMLPEEKPKLHVRRILYRKDLFMLRHGVFSLNPSLKPSSEESGIVETGVQAPGQDRPQDEMLVLEGGGSPLYRRHATDPDADTATTPEPEPPAERSPPPRPRLPRADHFTKRLEDILGTNTRFRVNQDESKSS